MGFPTDIKTFSTKTDNVDEIMAVDINDIQTEITAIETELGLNPRGAYGTVKARLDAIDTAFSTTPSGSGTANYLTKWTGTYSIGNSLIRDDGVTIAIGVPPNSNYKFYSVSEPIATSGTYAAGYFLMAAKPTSTSSGLSIGLYGSAYNDSAYDIYTVEGLRFNASLSGAGGVTYLRGLKITTNSAATSSGAVTVGSGLDITLQKLGSGPWSYAWGTNINAITSIATTQEGLVINDISGGTTNNSIRTYAGNIVFNEGGNSSSDIRMEGDTLVNLFFLKASTDHIGINTNLPDELFDVAGLSRAQTFTADGDYGSGASSTIRYTGVTDTPTASLDWSSVGSPNGYEKHYVGTQAVVVPYWNT